MKSTAVALIVPPTVIVSNDEGGVHGETVSSTGGRVIRPPAPAARDVLSRLKTLSFRAGFVERMAQSTAAATQSRPRRLALVSRGSGVASARPR